MTSERWKRIRDIVADALERSPSEWPGFLDRACEGDSELRAEVEALLQQDREPSFLDPPDIPHKGDPESTVGIRVGDYELQRELGRGGMGVVYLANQVGLDRSAAVKILASSILTTDLEIERFHREARAVAKLSHPSIATVFSEGVDDGTHFFAMEHIDGPTLADEIERLRNEGPPSGETSLPPRDDAAFLPALARLICELARGLQHAHDNGVVHRDVKPQNIMLPRQGGVKLLDFGISRDEQLGTLTASGVPLGSPSYMSPEQARAESNRVDHRTDVYSLGVVFYEALTLQQPFRGKTSAEVLKGILGSMPPAPTDIRADIPRDLELICRTAMAREIEDRYSSAGALAADLERFLSFRAVNARPPSLARRLRLSARRHPIRLVTGTFLSAALLVGSALIYNELKIRRQLRAPIERVMGEENWSTVDNSTLFSALDAAKQLELRNANEAIVGRFRERLTRFADAQRTQVQNDLQTALSNSDDPTLGAIPARAVLDLQGQLYRLRFLTDDPSIDQVISSEVFDPRLSVSVTGTSSGGSVSVREINQRTGEPLDSEPLALGALPIRAEPVPAGVYRVFITLENGRVRECTRVLDIGHIQVAVPIREEADSTAGMVLIDGSAITIPGDPPNMCANQEQAVEVASFWIDECEVSMREYRDFLEATGRPYPTLWAPLEDLDALDNRPAVGMSWIDAQAFAEWSGKRLPSHAEWELAARGPLGRLYPWIDGSDPSSRAKVDGDLLVGLTATLADLYSTNTIDVRSLPQSRTDTGLYHMLGHVAEWTETVHTERQPNGSYAPQTRRRIVLGAAWDVNARGGPATLAWHAHWGIENSFARMNFGFRCARSADPTNAGN